MTSGKEQTKIRADASVEGELKIETPKIIQFRGKDINELQISKSVNSAKLQKEKPFLIALRNSLDRQTRVGQDGIQGFENCEVEIKFIHAATEWMLNEYLNSVISQPNSYEYSVLARKVAFEKVEKKLKIADFESLVANQNDFQARRDLFTVFIRYFYQFVDPSIQTIVPKTIRNLADFLGKQVQFRYFGRYLINELLSYDDGRLLRAKPDLLELMSEDKDHRLVMKKNGRRKFLDWLYSSSDQNEKRFTNLESFLSSLLYTNPDSKPKDFAVEVLGLAESIPVLCLSEWYNGLHFDKDGKPHNSNKTIHTVRNSMTGRLLIVSVYQTKYTGDYILKPNEPEDPGKIDPEIELTKVQIPETAPITKTISDPIILGEIFMKPIIRPKEKFARVVVKNQWNKLYEVIFKPDKGITIELVGEYKDGLSYAKSDGRGAITPETEENNKYFYWSGASEVLKKFNSFLKSKKISFAQEWLTQFTPTSEVRKQKDGTFEIFWSVDPFYYIEVLASLSTCIRIFSDKNGEIFAQERPDLEPYKIAGSDSWIEKNNRGFYNHFTQVLTEKHLLNLVDGKIVYGDGK